MVGSGYASLFSFMTDWQPIETAPKDGSEIDIWEYCHDPVWRPDPKDRGIENGIRYTNVRWEDRAWHQFQDYLGDWVDVAGADNHYTVSHWMPIPQAPTT